MPKINANGLTMNFDQQGSGEPTRPSPGTRWLQSRSRSSACWPQALNRSIAVLVRMRTPGCGCAATPVSRLAAKPFAGQDLGKGC